MPPGTRITIEPMSHLGEADVVLEADGWNVTTKDGSLSDSSSTPLWWWRTGWRC